MQIQNGKLFINKTWLYLYPCLKFYGEDLNKYLNSVIKLAVGIKDSNKDYKEPCIFILLDTKPPIGESYKKPLYEKSFIKFLNWIREQSYFMEDYLYKDIINDYPKHMVVLKIPEKYESSYKVFLEGKYSEMYTKEDILKFFTLKKHENIIKVLIKATSYVKTFVDKVNKDFGTNVSEKYFKDAELDYPPNTFSNEEYF